MFYLNENDVKETDKKIIFLFMEKSDFFIRLDEISNDQSFVIKKSGDARNILEQK